MKRNEILRIGLGLIVVGGGVAALLAVDAKDTRGPERAETEATWWELDGSAVVASSAWTRFDCLEEGVTGEELCWLKDDTTICAEAVNGEYVATGGMLASQQDNCLSDAVAHLLLRFDPPPGYMHIGVKRHAGELWMVCWADADLIGDEGRGWRFDPLPNIDPDGMFYGLGFGGTGVAACAVHGAVDALAVY
jgi:hypothetical protein